MIIELPFLIVFGRAREYVKGMGNTDGYVSLERIRKFKTTSLETELNGIGAQ